MNGDAESGGRKTTQTSLSIVDALAELGGGTLTEIADHTGLSPSTLHSHLITLENSEYVVRKEGEYKLGMRLFHLGEQARHRDERFELAKEKAYELANQMNEEVNFSIEEHGRAIVIFDETPSPSKEGYQVGRYFYMHGSASGKAMLAAYDQDRVREIIDRWGLPALTANTITDRQELFEELTRTKERGFAVNDQESLEGLQSVAVVAKEPDGSVFGTLDVSGPPYRLPEYEDIATRLKSLVNELEADLENYKED